LETQKKCTQCKEEKPLNSFYLDKREGRGYKTICKECENRKKRMKRSLDWKLENQPISLFISAFKKRFGSHENFSDDFISLYKNSIKLKAQIENKKEKIVFLERNLVCLQCGFVSPVEKQISLHRLKTATELFIKIHEKC
jgi:hypothetical protein